MSAINSTAFPVYGQAFRARGAVYNASTGLPITGGLTGLAAVISKDDGASASTVNAPVESGIPGTFYLDLTAAEMTADGVVIYITATNTNAFSPVIEIVPLQLGSTTSVPWWEQPILLFEQIVLQNNTYLFGANSTVSGAQTVLNRDGSVLATGTLQSSQNGTMRSQLS